MATRNYLLLTISGWPRGDDPLDAAGRRAAAEATIAACARLLERGRLAGIVVADGTGLEAPRRSTSVASTAVEWLPLSTTDYPVPCHRGYEEFRLADDAVSRSVLLRAAGDDAVVWKHSSSRRVSNLARVLRWAPGGLDFYGAARGDWADMGLLAWSLRGYRALVHEGWHRFEGAEPPEVALYRALRGDDAAGLRVVRSFLWPPHFEAASTPAPRDPLDAYRFRLLVARKLLTLPWRSLRLL